MNNDTELPADWKAQVDAWVQRYQNHRQWTKEDHHEFIRWSRQRWTSIGMLPGGPIDVYFKEISETNKARCAVCGGFKPCIPQHD